MGEAKRRKALDPNFGKGKEQKSSSSRRGSAALSLLEENQKIPISQLVKDRALASVPSSLELEALSDIFYSALGKGIVCLTNDNQPAYVPLKNLRSTQGGAISIVSAYDPEVEFVVHSRLSPKDAKAGVIEVNARTPIGSV